MFLRILENRPLQRLLFKGQTQEIRNFLDDYLCKYFTKKDTWFYEVQPEALLNLNDILFYFKEHFSSTLGSAPLPFSFLIAEDKRQLPRSPQFRPGKIYVQDKWVNTIKKLLKNKDLFFKIEKVEEDLSELILPSTVDIVLILPYKDIFFSPELESCFFCGTYLHESKHCPGLGEKEPFKEFQSYLRYSFEHISHKLWEALKAIGDETFYNGFFCRHFYLFPAFLKIPFYFFTEIENWANLNRPIDFPVRGGDLYLALEDLLLGKLTAAENKFKSLENEIRADLGLLMINILKGDLSQAIYYLENVLVEAKTPFLKSYLLFLKGYINHYQRDYLTAEEFYREALKDDNSCFPAYYFLHLLLYQEEENWQKVFPFFQNPYTIYLAFLEPLFIKHQRELEENLQKSVESFREETVKRLREVEDKFHKLKEVLTDEEKAEYDESIKKLRDHTYRGGLILIEEAGKRALELSLELNSYIFSKVKKFKKELEKIANSYIPLERFWELYPYKKEDYVFGKKLTKAGEIFNNIEKKLKKSEIAKEIKFIQKELNSLQSLITELETLKTELQKKWNFREKLYKFLVRFLTAEGILVLLFLSNHLLPNLFSSIPIFTLPNFFLFSFILFIFIFLSVQINIK